MSIECDLCHTDNNDSAVNCARCGAALGQTNISDAAQVNTVNIVASTPILTLTDVKTGKEIKIEKSCILGREGDIESEYFSKSMHVSRKHSNIVLDKNEYKIEHLSNVSPTRVNNRVVSKGFKQIIRNGDVLAIADLEFKVSVCAAVLPATNICNPVVQEPKTVKTKYIITCPKCGKKYDVKDINEKITECEECDDFDKEEIKKISAMEVIEDAN